MVTSRWSTLSASCLIHHTVITLTRGLLCVSRSYSYEECKATADWLLAQTDVRPTVGIVCGSGLGGLADMIKDQVIFNYKDIPNFPQSTGAFRSGRYLPWWLVLRVTDWLCCFLQFTVTRGDWCLAP